jgi:hypothetical protein
MRLTTASLENIKFIIKHVFVDMRQNGITIRLD